VLGLGALAMGAGRAILVEADPGACDAAMANAESMGLAESVEIVSATLGSDPVDLGAADLIVSNPPWGRQTARRTGRPWHRRQRHLPGHHRYPHYSQHPVRGRGQ